jgi:ribosomal protein L25 (general stress protein Ctc)
MVEQVTQDVKKADKEPVVIEGKARTETGKSFTRKLRRAGRLPAVLNSKGKSMLLDIDPKWLSRAWRDGGKQFKLELEGKTTLVKIVELQLDPVKRVALHVELAPL